MGAFFTHEAVWLIVHCRNCGRKMDITCELSTSGKKMRWGYYRYYITRKESQELEPHLSYNRMKKVYDRMCQHYNLIGRNCSHWARQFYFLICLVGDV
ncbi:unnamed protein product [Meloidogyne enterolobii]|uniref:Uncharacterized protein n=1 Tax=Meloidogyne enterolobii TaxID=390850 RepID=A0ACB1AF58_MELEN